MISTERSYHPTVLTIRMNRPEKRNALNQELVRSLTDAVTSAAGDSSVRAVVLTGSGKAFSAGADLDALERMADATIEDNLADSRLLADLFESIYALDKPIIARVNGHAIAGGCGLASVCDYVVADARARFGFSEVRIGFVPAIISVYLLERFPESSLRPALLSGSILSAQEAKALGIVHAVGSDSEEVEELMTQSLEAFVRDTSPAAVASTKRLLRKRFAGRHQSNLDAAVRLNAEARSSEACRAGVAAFLRKDPLPWFEDWLGNR